MADDLVAIPRSDIQDLIGGISGFKCYWDGEGMDYDTTYVALSIGAYVGVDTDERRVTYDASTDQLRTLTCGIRLFTLSIEARSYDMDLPGYEICERIRRRLRAGAARAVMEDVGLALVDFRGGIVDRDAIADNRPIYLATMDVRMSFAVNETDIQPQGGGDYIADAPTTGTATGGVVPHTITTK